MALGHLDELQKAEKYPIRWSLDRFHCTYKQSSADKTFWSYHILLIYGAFVIELEGITAVAMLLLFSSDNGLSPDWHPTIIWTNVGMLLIGHVQDNFIDIITNVVYKMAAFCLGLIMLTHVAINININPFP